jgi:hypothetical protein
MKFLDRWLIKILERAREKELENSKIVSSPIPVEEYDTKNTLRFLLTPARGGIVMTINTYDNRRDESNRTVYVINEAEDVSQRVAEIVSLELMKV